MQDKYVYLGRQINRYEYISTGFPGDSSRKKPASQMQKTQETWVWSLGWEDPLEKKMATHSSILGKYHGWGVWVDVYSPWGCKESDITECVCTRTHTCTHAHTFPLGALIQCLLIQCLWDFTELNYHG